jgi:dual-specificity kinase
MQAVIHRQLPPPLLDQYHPPSLALNPSRLNPPIMPTPPVVSRKRKRAHQYTVSYSEVQEVDNEGRVREVIVIEDTPPPPSTISPATTHTNGFSVSRQPPLYSAPIRTRARAAAEAQALSASTSSTAIVAPAPKKRKRDQADETRGTLTKKVATGLQHQAAVPSSKSWASGSGPATTDVRNDLLPPRQELNRHIFLIPGFQWCYPL